MRRFARLSLDGLPTERKKKQTKNPETQIVNDYITDVSGQSVLQSDLDATGQLLSGNTQTTGFNLSGALIRASGELRAAIVGNTLEDIVLSGDLIETGEHIHEHIDIVSGNLLNTGSLLETKLHNTGLTLETNLYNTGQVLDLKISQFNDDIIDISGEAMANYLSVSDDLFSKKRKSHLGMSWWALEITAA